MEVIQETLTIFGMFNVIFIDITTGVITSLRECISLRLPPDFEQAERHKKRE
jgi:hypothetical protein